MYNLIKLKIQIKYMVVWEIKNMKKEENHTVKLINIGQVWRNYHCNWIQEVEVKRDTCLICQMKEEKNLKNKDYYGIEN